MKLSEVWFDDLVPVPGWQREAGGTTTAREAVFRSTDGWDIDLLESGAVSLLGPGMTNCVLVAGYGYSAVPLETKGPGVKRARRV